MLFKKDFITLKLATCCIVVYILSSLESKMINGGHFLLTAIDTTATKAFFSTKIIHVFNISRIHGFSLLFSASSSELICNNNQRVSEKSIYHPSDSCTSWGHNGKLCGPLNLKRKVIMWTHKLWFYFKLFIKNATDQTF